jgi:curved DNA-binding protein CbpA
VRGFYQGLDLGRVDLASAVEQGLDYYLLLGLSPTARDEVIQAAYQRIRLQFPPTKSRLVPQMARRLELIEQAAYILCEPQRRRVYDNLRQARLSRHDKPADEATRGMACYRSGRFDDAARLLRAAARRAPDDESLHLHYCLSLLYGCAHLASPEDWRVSEMIKATEQAMQASNDSQMTRAHNTLCHAIDHYDKGRFEQGWIMLSALTEALPNWHLPWIISAFWKRREGDFGEVLARAERARRLSPQDPLLSSLRDVLRRAWATAPALLAQSAQRAAQVLADGTPSRDIEAAWR